MCVSFPNNGWGGCINLVKSVRGLKTENKLKNKCRFFLKKASKLTVYRLEIHK
jgi:hypothetical protein